MANEIDWTADMTQTYEYYIVDPGTWKDKEKLENVISGSIGRDSEAETLGSASIELQDWIGECYVRVYLIAIQNGITHKEPLGTVLIQTPSSNFDGKSNSVSVDAYTPLLELKENMPPIGFSLLKGDNIMEQAHKLIRENARAPVVKTECSSTLSYDFISNTDDNWLVFVNDLITNAKYTLDLDALGRILFAPKQDVASLQPVWTFTDDNSSILEAELQVEHDLYGIPNVVEVIYSSGNDVYYAKVVNDDPNSPTSTVNRGREITHRITSPDVSGEPSEAQIKEYAEQTLRDLSTLEYTITYTHAYCPVRVGDCVMFNHESAGLMGVKAKVISQTIKCETGCSVSEKAVYTAKLWR